MEGKYNIPEEFLGGAREDFLDIDATVMATAITWAARSKDPSSQVGAVFVNEQNRVISIGYNGTPIGWTDDEFPWKKDGIRTCPCCNNIINEYDSKYPYVIHAEMNGILNYKGLGTDFENSTVYVTLFPCADCAKFLAQRGIKKVVYLSDKYKGKPGNIAAKYCLDKMNVVYEKFEVEDNTLIAALLQELGIDLEKEGISRKRK